MIYSLKITEAINDIGMDHIGKYVFIFRRLDASLYQLTYVNFSCLKSTAALLATAIDRSSPFIVLVSHGAKTID